jgi:hypothetical protein
METTFYNIIDSLKFAFGDEKWQEIVDETWRVMKRRNYFAGMNKGSRMMSYFISDSSIFTNMPHTTAQLIIDCFYKGLFKSDDDVYGFGKKSEHKYKYKIVKAH